MPHNCLVIVLFALSLAPARAADIEFVTQELPWAIVDRPYSPPPLAVRTSGACPLGGLGYAIVSGGLPDGMALSRLGYFSGTALKTGTFEFAVRVSNGCTWTTRHYVLTVTGAPILSVNPTKLSFGWKTGSTLPANQVLRVSATWPRFNYSVSSDAVWLKAAPEHGFTPRGSSAMAEDFVTVAVDPANLPPGKYSAAVTLSGWEALSAPVVNVELTISDGSSVAPVPTGKLSPTGSPTNASRP